MSAPKGWVERKLEDGDFKRKLDNLHIAISDVEYWQGDTLGAKAHEIKEVVIGAIDVAIEWIKLDVKEIGRDPAATAQKILKDAREAIEKAPNKVGKKFMDALGSCHSGISKLKNMFLGKANEIIKPLKTRLRELPIEWKVMQLNREAKTNLEGAKKNMYK